MIARDSFSLSASQNEQRNDVAGDDGIPSLSSTSHHPRSSSPETAPPQKEGFVNFVLLPQSKCLHLRMWRSFAYTELRFPSLEAEVRWIDLALFLKCMVHTQSSEVRSQMSVPGMLWAPPVQDLTSSFLRKFENHC